MTGSALQICAGQVSSLLGYSNKLKWVLFSDPSTRPLLSSDNVSRPCKDYELILIPFTICSTRGATYRVIIDTLKHLPDTKRDAAFGLSGLLFLYVVRYSLRKLESRTRNPVVKKLAFFGQTLRTAFVIIFLTIFAWVHLRGMEEKEYDISILRTVPSGFQHIGQPQLPTKLLSLIAPQLPVSTIILLLEHIAIAKSFGRINNYKIRADQELVSIGVSNLVGTLFAAFPATGSFSRSAIKAKGKFALSLNLCSFAADSLFVAGSSQRLLAGVRTPLAGWYSGICVIVALYALTGAFYWIPNAALAAVGYMLSFFCFLTISNEYLFHFQVIIHAVLDLVASPATVYSFWKVSPLEACIFMLAVIVSVFATIEIGIYVSFSSLIFGLLLLTLHILSEL